MLFRIIGITLLLLGIWQLVQARNGWKVYKDKSQKTDNPLRAYGFAYSFIIGLAFVVLGLSVALGALF